MAALNKPCVIFFFAVMSCWQHFVQLRGFNLIPHSGCKHGYFSSVFTLEPASSGPGRSPTSMLVPLRRAYSNLFTWPQEEEQPPSDRWGRLRLSAPREQVLKPGIELLMLWSCAIRLRLRLTLLIPVGKLAFAFSFGWSYLGFKHHIVLVH